MPENAHLEFARPLVTPHRSALVQVDTLWCDILGHFSVCAAAFLMSFQKSNNYKLRGMLVACIDDSNPGTQDPMPAWTTR